MERSMGVLLAISSLPSKYGIGCFDESAYKFVDKLKKAGQSYWQILPLVPTSYGDSPYQSFSTFAGNPYFICLDELIKDGLLTEEECNVDVGGDPEFVDYEKIYNTRFKLLRKAFERSDSANCEEFKKYCVNADWLQDYALFMAVKDKYGGVEFSKWDNDIRMREPQAVQRYSSELAADIEFYKYLQYLFDKQWRALREYANENNVKIIGDIPIYVASDSADVWANPELFQLDENRNPKGVAGCPPDAFSEDGQLWGNPLYDWSMHKASGYKWWIKRMAHCFKLYDVVRIDHFRGFDEYYAIPFGAKNARVGEWEKGPGFELFQAIESALGKKEIIAEDLGFVTDTVIKLVKDCGYPNMKVVQFAFDPNDRNGENEHLPHNFAKNCVAYTGTHDNQTLASWFKSITEFEQKKARKYIGAEQTSENRLPLEFIKTIMRSQVNLCVVPMQDWLALDDRCRMNMPSTVGCNWKWRIKEDAMSDALCKEMRSLTEMCGRIDQQIIKGRTY